MKYFVSLALALVCLATPLRAGIEGIIEGNISDRQGPIADAKIEATVDPEWGLPAGAFEELRRKFREEYCQVSGSAETTTNRDGTYSIKVPVTASDEAKLPKHTIDDENRKNQMRPYVVVTLLITKPGYRSVRHFLQVAVDGSRTKHTPQLSLGRTYVARLVDASGKPVAGARIGVNVSGQGFDGSRLPPPAIRDAFPFNRIDALLRSELVSISQQRDYVTDKQGGIQIPDLGLDSFSLRFLEAGWAFPMRHAAWSGIQLQGGKNDGGTITVVPGGGLKLRAVAAESGSPVSAELIVMSKVPDRHVFLTVVTSEQGEVMLTGLPVTTYQVNVNPRTPADVAERIGAQHDEIAVPAGKLVDMGDVQLEPFHTVEFKAVDDHGGFVQQFSVKVTPDLATLPPNVAMGRDRSRGDGSWTVNDKVVRRLLRGTWRAEVMCRGCPPVFVTLTVPCESPVVVKVETGGSVEISGQINHRLNSWLLVAISAPCFDAVKSMPAAGVRSAFEAGLDRTKIYAQPEYRRGAPLLEGVPAGEYVMFASWGNEQYVRVDGVVVKRGETTTVKVDLNAPAELRVRVTEKGQPKPGVALVAVVKSFQRSSNWGEEDKQDRVSEFSATSDAQGIAAFGVLALGKYQVLTRREHEWRNNQGKQGRSPIRELGVPQDENQFQLSPGDRMEYALEMFHPGRTWLTVRIKGPESIPVSEASLCLSAGSFATEARTVTQEGGALDFGLVRLGDYDLFDGNGFWKGSSFSRQIAVNKPQEQTVHFEFTACTLQLTLVYPPELKNNRFTTHLSPILDDREHSGFGIAHREAKPAGDGNLEIVNVPSGTYHLTVWTVDSSNMVWSRGVVVKLPGDKSVTLNFKTPTGAVRFDVRVGDRSLSDLGGFMSDGPLVWAEYRVNGKVVPVHGQVATRLRDGRHDVPAGVYEVRLYGRGVESQTFKNVKVKAGEDTVVKAQLTPTQRLVLNIENIQDGSLYGVAVKCEALDAEGKPIPMDEPGCQTVLHPRFGVGEWDELRKRRLAGCMLIFTNVPARCVRMRVTVDGYRTIELDVKAGPPVGHSYITDLEKR